VETPPTPKSYNEFKIMHMPLLPNERAVPGYDLSPAKFSGSYNLVWIPEQIEILVKASGQEQERW
jgi:phospholipase A2